MSRDAVVHRDRTWLVVAVGAVLVVVLVVVLSVRAAGRVNHVALVAAPHAVSVVPAASTTYREARTYVGAVEPWIEAQIGPQYISAYVQTVLVRPGAVVKQGDVLATLDCSNPNAATRAVQMKARARAANAQAAEDEATRMSSLLDGGFASANDVEQKSAVSLAEQSEMLETKANLLKSSLEVKDCVLRAPWGGEIGTRSFDPGAFVRPGASIVSVVDRSVVRVSVDASEKDFEALAPGTVVRIDVAAVGAHVSAPISRRAPEADPRTRTVHFEVDVPDPSRHYPVATTAIVHVDVGEPVAATEIPLYAATETSSKARFFVVEGDVAHARTVPVLGEIGGELFFDPHALVPGTQVVTEGRALLNDGDKVRVGVDTPPPADRDAGGGTRGGGYGRSL